MPAEDKQLARNVLREFGKRPLDISRMTVYAVGGIIYLNGQISALRGHDINLREELENVITSLKQRAGIREVVNQLTLR